MTAPTLERDDRAAIDKAISLLASFGDEASVGVGVSELARRADLSKSTAHRVLITLERNGVVERIGTKYRLGARLHRLGRAVYPSTHDRVRDLLIPHLAALYEETHETVHLAALHGADVVYLAKLYGTRPVPCPSRIGGRIAAYSTAIGKVLLAYDPEAATEVLAGGLRPRTPRTIVDGAALITELAQIRQEGMAFDDEEAQVGLQCVAVPVMAPGGWPVAALSVSVGAGRVDPRRYECALRRICAEAARTVAAARLTVAQRKHST